MFTFDSLDNLRTYAGMGSIIGALVGLAIAFAAGAKPGAAIGGAVLGLLIGVLVSPLLDIEAISGGDQDFDVSRARLLAVMITAGLAAIPGIFVGLAVLRRH